MKQRFSAQRRNRLVQMVFDKGSVSITDAARQFNVSTETIRKDIIDLDAQGLIKKVRGGAVRREDAREPDMEYPVLEKRFVNADKKRAICTRALDFIPDGASIILDAGSTPLALAELLAQKSGYTIFTDSVPAVNILVDSDNTVFVLGGLLRRSSGATLGDWTNMLLENIQADVAFIGTDACQPNGPMITPYEEVVVKRKMFSVSQKSILLADSTKFGKAAAFLVCGWEDIDLVITDSDVTPQTLNAYQDRVTIDVAVPIS